MGLASGSVGLGRLQAARHGEARVPHVTGPVAPGDVVGNDPVPPVIVPPVGPVTMGPVTGADDGATGGALPVGDASGGGPSDSSACPPPPHAASRTNAVADVSRFRRTRAPFGRLTVHPAPRVRRASVRDRRCSLTVHARPRARRRGPARRAPSRRLVRRAVRRGEDVHVDPSGRRQGRGAHDRARPRRGRPGLRGDVVRLRLLEPAGSRGAAGRGRSGERRAPRRRRGRRGRSPRRSSGPP